MALDDEGLSILWSRIAMYVNAYVADHSVEYGVATSEILGLVKPDGETITVDQDGTIRGAQTYRLPAATTASLGGVKPDGETITVDSDGTIHGANTYTLPVATTSELGGVMPDGTSIAVEEDGTISAPLPNWDQNNQYGAGYIENRPFYRTTSTVLETTTMRAWSASGTMPPYHPKARDVPIGSSLVLGATYLVKMSGRIWNGEYFVTCRDASSIGIDGFTSGLVLHATRDSSGTGGISRNEFVIHQPYKSINSVNVCFKLPDVEGYNYWQYQESSLSIDRYYVTTIPFMYLPIPTDTERGAVRPDGVTITVDQDGTIHGSSSYVLPVATTSRLGGVMPDGTTTGTDQSGHISVIGPHLELRRDTDNRLRVAIVMEAQ